MQNGLLWLKRLGLCFLPLLLVDLYMQATASARMLFYFPVGLLGCAVYVWFVSTRMNKVYPHPQRAVGQLCIAFLLLSLAATNEVKTLKSKISPENANDYIYALAVANGKGAIASVMFILLLLSYLALRIKNRKSITKIENPSTKTCPMCAETIKYEAIKCRFCGHLISQEDDQSKTDNKA